MSQGFAGDFNIDILSNTNAMRNYVDTFHQYGLINEINLPTYVSPSTGFNTSSIDHLWHNLNCSKRSKVVSLSLSDHYVFCVIFITNHDTPPNSKIFRDFSEANAELFALNIENEYIFFSLSHSNTNEYAD